MRPVIGLTVSVSTDEGQLYTPLAYPEAVHQAGGLPLLIPAVTDEETLNAYLDQVDGLLLSGGDDVDPQCYGEDQIWQCGEIIPLRDQYELALTRLAMRRNLPVLGICRGVQLLNVALGGTLYQDLQSQRPDSICHGQKQKSMYASHRVSVREGSRLYGIYQTEEMMVNSHHHQAVKGLGDGLVAASMATDGVIEAIELPDHPFCIGVQWHPERMIVRAENALQKRLFTAFVDACRNK